MANNVLDKIISRVKEKVLQQLQILEENEKEIKVLKEEVEKLDKERETCYTSLALIPVEDKRKFNFFQKIFSRKYKEYVQQKQQEEKKRQELNKKSNAIIDKKHKLEKKIRSKEQEIKNFDKDNLIKKLEALENEDKAIETIIADYPELTERVDFMKEIVERVPECIKYDKTDNKEVYILYLKTIRDSYARQEGDTEIEVMPYMQLGKCIKQLEEPTKVSNDKYEIPMKYLFEAIRMSKNDPYMSIWFYNEDNGRFPIEYGKFFEQLYDNPELILAVHGIGRNSAFSDRMIEENEERKRKIMCEGLKATNSMGELEGNSSPMLAATAKYQGQEGVTFFDFLDYDYASSYGYFLMGIPKAGLVKKRKYSYMGNK